MKFSNGSNNIRTSGDVRNPNTNTPETKHIASLKTRQILIHFITDFCTWEKVNSKALIPKKVISKTWMIQYPHTVLGCQPY
jgi:hypothetical protein